MIPSVGLDGILSVGESKAALSKRLFHLICIGKEDLVEFILVVLNVLAEAFVKLYVVLSVLPASTMGSSSEVVDGVLLMWLVQLPVSLEASLLLMSCLVFALVSRVFKSSLNKWISHT